MTPLTTKPLTMRASRRTSAVAACTIALASLGAVTVSSPAAAGTVSVNWIAQYTPPAGPLPSQNGDLITPAAADLTLPVAVGPRDLSGNYVNFPSAKDFHLVMYRTTDARGVAIPVTAMVIRSKANLANYPIGSLRPMVAYAPGNQGMDDGCASSAAVRSGAWYENFPVQGILSKGFDVVVPDYEGLGINDGRLHPVANNRSNGQATLDSLRAAQLAMPAFKAYVNGTYVADPAPVPLQMAVWGYSEGGGAAAWAASHITTYAHPDVRSKIIGVAAGGVTADLRIIGQVADGEDQAARPAADFSGNPIPGRFTVPGQKIDPDTSTAAPNGYSALILQAAASFEATYTPSVASDPANGYDHTQFDLSTKLTNDTSTTSLYKGTGWIAQVKQDCLIDGLAVAPGLHVANYVRNTDGTAGSPAVAPFPGTTTATAQNPLNNSVWVQKFKENNPAYGGATPSVPMFLYHGTNDVSVAYSQDVELRERWCAAGANIFWRRYLGQEHIQTWGNWASPLGWLQQQFYKNAGLTNGAAAYANNCAIDPSLL